MKVPEKIYVEVCEDGIFAFEEPPFEESIEYIRKDTLLEKLEKVAPDKIYIPQHNIEAGTIQELGELIIEGSVEYIRKDALLEWAKDWAERYPYSHEFQMIIDKLNSM